MVISMFHFVSISEDLLIYFIGNSSEHSTVSWSIRTEDKTIFLEQRFTITFHSITLVLNYNKRDRFSTHYH